MLLDVNLWLAIAWEHHAHHSIALKWFNQHSAQGWASCALTQAGFVRLLSQPAFAQSTGHQGFSMKQVIETLNVHTAHPAHHLLSLNFGFDAVLAQCTGGIQGHRQITDAYLLTLAIKHKIKLATFDSGIASLLATAAERNKHIELLA